MTDPLIPSRAAGPIGPPRELTASFILGTLTRHDAIATACRRHMEALRLFCAARGMRLRLKVYAFSSEVDEPAFQRTENPAQIVRDDHFQQSDLVVYEFGIEFNLYDSIHLAPRPARVLVFHYGVTHPHLAPAASRPLLHRSYAQMRNLFAADEVYVTSQFVADELRRIGLPSSKVHLLGLPAGVAVEAIPNHDPRPSGPNRPLKALYVGRFVPAKRVSDLIEALALCRRSASPPIELTLLGSLIFSDRAYVEELRSLAQTLSVADAVTWLFDAPAATLSDAYHNADVLVIPSSHEGFCVPVIEAYQHSCGVIGSNAAALPETIGGLGLTYPCGDPDALADALTQFHADLVQDRIATDSGSHDLNEWHTLITSHLEQFRLDHFQAAMAEVYARNLIEPVEPAVRRRMAQARTSLLDQLRDQSAPPLASPLVDHLQPLYDLLDAGPVPAFSAELPQVPAPLAEPPAPSRRRLAWIQFKRAVKEVPVVAPVAVWSKRRIVAVLRLRRPVWQKLKRGLRRVPLLGRAAIHAKHALLMPRTIQHHHHLLHEMRQLTESLSHQIERLGHAVHESRITHPPAHTLIPKAHELGHGRPASVYLSPATASTGEEAAPGTLPAQSSWLGVHPATYDGRLRVVVGCGIVPWPDHLNVDDSPEAQPDIVAAPTALPFPPGSVLELIIQALDPATTRHAFESSLLPHWCALLASHSMLKLIAQDPQAWLERLPTSGDSATMPATQPNASRWPDSLSPSYLMRVLKTHGFHDVRISSRRWSNGLPEVEIAAERRTSTAGLRHSA